MNMFTTKQNSTIYHVTSEKGGKGDLIAYIEKAPDTYLNRFGNRQYYEVNFINIERVAKFKTLKQAKECIINQGV